MEQITQNVFTCLGSNQVLCLVDQVQQYFCVIRGSQVHPLGDLELRHGMTVTMWRIHFYCSKDALLRELTYCHCVPVVVGALVGCLLVLQLDHVPQVLGLVVLIWPVLVSLSQVTLGQSSNHYYQTNLAIVTFIFTQTINSNHY